LRRTVDIEGRVVGDGHSVFIIAEIGINHNGDIAIAKKLIDAAAQCGCDAVKFQKRDPEQSVPKDQRGVMRETPWGMMTYLDYRYRVEFSKDEYHEIARHCRTRNLAWTASCWDVSSAKFLKDFDVAFHKIPSALITNLHLVAEIATSGKPIIFSTGMSTLDEIDSCYEALVKGGASVGIMHTTSTYPCPVEELNLRMIGTLRERFAVPVGYSGHEVGLSTTAAAVALGANLVERHITLDRSMWGTDQAASVEPVGFQRLVRDIRAIERALGDGVKRVYVSEQPSRTKLRVL